MQELTVRLGTQAGSPARWQARGLQRLSERMGIEGVLDLLLKTGPYGRRPAWLGRSLDWLGQRPLATALTAAIKRRIDASGHAGQLLAGLAPLSRHARDLGLDRLREHPHGLDLGPLQPVLPERLFTEDKTIHLSPPEFVSALADLKQATPAESPRGPGRRLLVIGRRHVRSNNSWMHNSQRLVKGKDRCTVILHPQDAQALALSDGQTVTLRSQVGEISLPVQVSDGIMPGVASVPHGWGHNKPGTRLSVAEKHAGASLNDLTDSALTDPLNGVAVLNGFWVRASSPAPA
ncbi:MAG: molybdopterin dinucleotide binding domain-containing protein [Perlucidibaca sp.]